MSGPKQKHALAIGIIVIQLGSIAMLSQRDLAATSVASGSHRSPESPTASRPDINSSDSASPQHQIELDQLRATGEQLEEQIQALRASRGSPLLSSGDSVPVPLEYFSTHRNWWEQGAFLSINHQLWDTLMISPDEARVIEEASNRFLSQLKEIERSRLIKEIDADGLPVYTVPPSPDLAAPLMAGMAELLTDELGAGRGSIIYDQLRSSIFLHGSEQGLRIGRAGVSSDLFPSVGTLPLRPYVQLIPLDGSTHAPENHPIPPDAQGADRIFDRFDHLLEVETAQEIGQLFQPRAEE
ncbi:MAG: hypothetical protein ACR2RV_16570 [Verrucomicrobiales bacterium]